MPNASRQLGAYLDAFAQRLVTRQWAIGVAVAAVAGLGIILASAFTAARLGFPTSHLIAGRLALIAIVIAAIVLVAWLPARKLKTDAVRDIERRAPALNGRAETFAVMGAEEPLRELLAEETLDVAERFPPERQVRTREIGTPWLVSALAVGIVAAVAAFGPGNMSYAVRHLLAGWAVDGLLPPQTLLVSPGNETVRRGASLRIAASAGGFDPDSAMLHTAGADGVFTATPMRLARDGFERTLFSLREPTRYYVSAGAVRTPQYTIDVIDLPDVAHLQLTYDYPDWTGLEDEVVDPGGDIRALAGTDVTVTVVADAELPRTALINNDTEIVATANGANPAATLTVSEDGEYYVAALIGDERVRLTDDYFITVLEDEPPVIAFTRPGRDWNASNIEEVTTELSVKDDYQLGSAQLIYSVNGGDWASIDFDTSERELTSAHTFFLELLSGDDGAPLQPGDLVTYYAQATDRDQTSSTDMFFIQVQPFDQRYTQSQQAGGGGGGSGIGDEISERQREIIVSTWNQIREQNEARASNDTFFADNAKLLSELQATLRSQAISLAERSRARQLAGDDRIERFVEHLEDAAEAMTPASEQLAAVEFTNALGPEQQALQHLLRAEAVFRDISVSMQNNPGGAGGQAGRDLSEMFELEMDLEKNQYETGSNARNDTGGEALDELAEKLAELAERQQRLAERMRNRGDASASERWQQERLKRELEELKQELARSGGQPSDASSSGASGDSEAQTAQANNSEQSPTDSSNESPENSAETAEQLKASSEERQRQELERRMASAERAMAASDAAIEEGADAEAAANAAAEAARQLNRASAEAAAASAAEKNATLREFEQRARDLLAEQQDTARQLAEAMTRADGRDDGLDPLQRFSLVEQKRALQTGLTELEMDLKAAATSLETEDPRTAAALNDGLERLHDDGVKERLALAAAYIEQGEAQYVASSESLVTDAMDSLVKSMARAATESARGGQARPRDNVDQAVAATRALRRTLSELEARAQSASAPSPTPSAPTEGRLGGTGPAERSNPDDVGELPDMDSTELAEALAGTAEDIRRAANTAGNELRLSAEQAQGLRAAARELTAGSSARNDDIVAAEYRRVIALLDQVELTLQPAMAANAAEIRTTAEAAVDERHRVAVAEYYRRLADEDARRSAEAGSDNR